METRIENVLRECTARIEVPGYAGHGTGFFIAPKILITCNHVIDRNVKVGIKVHPFGSDTSLDAEVKHRFGNGVDLAVLQVSSLDYVKYRCVYIGHDVYDGDKCFAFGYTEPGEGFIEGDPVTLECEGIPGGVHRKIKLKGGQVLEGLSGSPLLNKRTGKVCGVMYRSRSTLRDLGGEAVSTQVIFSELSLLKDLHDDYHTNDNTWLGLLEFDAEPFLSDWNCLKFDWSRLFLYFRALKFLICTSIKWFFLGLSAPRAFPVDTVKRLLEFTFKGDLGAEINRQRDELTKRLDAEVDLDASCQARIINQLSSQSSILFHLINILVSDEQNLASISRLAWASELLYEQRELLEELKKKPGNSYPSIEKWKKIFPFLKTSYRQEDLYAESDKVISALVARYTDSNFLMLRSFNSSFSYCVRVLNHEPKIGIFCLNWLIYLSTAESSLNIRQREQDGDEYADITNAILLELEGNIAKYPRLKVLNKVKILLESVAGEPITGGRFRAWNNKGKYHFSRRCKFYPERVRPGEMKKILCYDSKKVAELHHKPCSLCIDAEKRVYLEDYFIGEE